MATKVTVDVTCDFCTRRIPVRGKVYHGRRGSRTIELPSVWVAQVDEDNVQLSQGTTIEQVEDHDFVDGVYCSQGCVLSAMPTLLKLYARRKAAAEKEQRCATS